MFSEFTINGLASAISSVTCTDSWSTKPSLAAAHACLHIVSSVRIMAATASCTASSVIDSAASPSNRKRDVYIDAEAARAAGWPWPKLPTRDEYLAIKLESWQAAEQAFHAEARLAATVDGHDHNTAHAADHPPLQQSGNDQHRERQLRSERPWTPPPEDLDGLHQRQAYFQQLVDREMEWHGLTARRWKVVYDHCKARLGMCDHSKKTLRFSHYLIARGSPSSMRDTVLHEIAHSLVGRRHGHNTTWRLVALEIGCSGERCYSGECLAQPAWVLRCSAGCWSTYRHQRVHALAARKCRQCHAPCEFVKSQ